MEQLYSLLRNNQTFGPCAIDELLKQNLSSTDLVWIEGKSMNWTYAGEIAVLKENVHQKQQLPQNKVYTVEDEDLQLVVKYKRSLDELKAEYARRPGGQVHHLPVPVWKNETVSLLVMLAVFVISFYITSHSTNTRTNVSTNSVVQLKDGLDAAANKQ